ncbi:MAG: histidinol-phosphatase [bacterium]
MVDYHIHTQHSIDASGTISEYCNQAVKIGLQEICFTNHCELDPERDDSFIRFNGEREPFSKKGLMKLQSEVNEARDRYKHQGLIVKFGIEVGYYKGIEQKLKGIIEGIDLDFVIGAIHCLDHICIDSSRECRRYFDRHDASQYVDNYYVSVASLIESGMFNSLAHIDVYKKYGRDHYGAEIADVPRHLVTRIFRMIKDNHIALEINTAGMRFMQEFYPAPMLMKIAHEQGVKLITIGSDSHKPEDLGKDLSLATEYLKSFGFDAVHTFDKRNPQTRKI